MLHLEVYSINFELGSDGIMVRVALFRIQGVDSPQRHQSWNYLYPHYQPWRDWIGIISFTSSYINIYNVAQKTICHVLGLQDGLKPFSWEEPFLSVPHQGQPKTFDFEFELQRIDPLEQQTANE